MKNPVAEYTVILAYLVILIAVGMVFRRFNRDVNNSCPPQPRREPAPHTASRSQGVPCVCVNVCFIVSHTSHSRTPDIAPLNQPPLHEIAVVLIELF